MARRQLNAPDTTPSKRHATNPIINSSGLQSVPKRSRISVYLSTDEASRVRAAYQALPGPERPPSLSQWIAKLVTTEADKIEAREGTLGRVKAGTLRKGRPFES